MLSNRCRFQAAESAVAMFVVAFTVGERNERDKGVRLMMPARDQSDRRPFTALQVADPFDDSSDGEPERIRSRASFNVNRCTGFCITKSRQVRSSGNDPEIMSTGVEGERSLVMCASSRPVMPGIVLSVITRSWVLGSNNASASCAVRADSTTKPKFVKNHFVVMRLASVSSTSNTVLRSGLGFSFANSDSRLFGDSWAFMNVHSDSLMCHRSLLQVSAANCLELQSSTPERVSH